MTVQQDSLCLIHNIGCFSISISCVCMLVYVWRESERERGGWVGEGDKLLIWRAENIEIYIL